MIFCKLPRAGLGNQLFVIAKSLIYEELNNTQIVFLNSPYIKIGPYLRNERSKRNYNGFFVFQHGYLIDFIKNKFYQKRVSKILISEPELIKEEQIKDVIFNEIPNHLTYFDELIPFRELLKKKMFKIISEKIQKEIINLKIIDVAVHVRLGDFQKLNSEADFGSISSARTPFSFFLEEMNKIADNNKNIKFTVFSDGYKKELEEILKFPNTELYKSKNDILDLYQMAKSNILITSVGSTFSYWAGFLGDCVVIQHPNHFRNIK